MVPMGDVELGQLVGKVEALSDAIELQRKENAEDHANVIKRLDSLSDQITAKAPAKWVEDQHERIDALERGRDEGKGQRVIIVALATLIGAPLVVGIFILLATRGVG
jgi:hypothetical protein